MYILDNKLVFPHSLCISLFSDIRVLLNPLTRFLVNAVLFFHAEILLSNERFSSLLGIFDNELSSLDSVYSNLAFSLAGVETLSVYEIESKLSLLLDFDTGVIIGGNGFVFSFLNKLFAPTGDAPPEPLYDVDNFEIMF
ncbi:unnamed protein product [Pneumocystis jirovecii]|uniref:Uncharacterized protein n=1 Tax=Pneumocystis jirovecii TaxID=42068 RepID=L0P8B7_PNEJI|nr:unnamed protein product [Pneumocystis jirovecii]